jgi:hypothetical protein
LHCFLNEHHFVFEMTMGKMCIYLPEEQEWDSVAPAWAKGKYPYVVNELKKWAEEKDIPVAKSLGSWVDFGQEHKSKT